MFRAGCAFLCASGSLPVRGAWVEISSSIGNSELHQSLPVRGAWVEIYCSGGVTVRRRSLPVRGAWVEIYCSGGVTVRRRGRSPCGERGLKSSNAHL